MKSIEWSPLLDVTRENVIERTIYGTVVIADSQHALSSTQVDPEIFGRSLMKPFQMKGIAKELEVLSWEERALALASHNGTAKHVEVAKSILKPEKFREMALPESAPLGGGSSEKSIWNNPCSGKHAAILRACEARGWPTPNYLAKDHPYNLEFLRVIETQLGESVAQRAVAPDGCLLPTYAMRVSELARLFAGLAKNRNEDWIWEAQHRNPELVGGIGRLDSAILKECPQVFAKEGADGLLGLSISDARFPQGLGIVIKLAQGYDMTILWYLAHKVLSDLAIEIPPAPTLSGQRVEYKQILSSLWDRVSH